MAELDQSLIEWRTERFEELGFRPEIAAALAVARDDQNWPISYHAAERLLKNGCSPDLILRILL